MPTPQPADCHRSKILAVTGTAANFSHAFPDEEMSFVMDYVATLSRAIKAITDNPIAGTNKSGNLCGVLGEREIEDINRLSTWISDVAEYSIEAFGEHCERMKSDRSATGKTPVD